MQLSQPQAGDPLPLWAQGLLAGGGLWTDMKRLADHDHSGGLLGKPIAGGLDQATADARYVNVAGGDTMAGPLVVSSGGVGVTGASTFSVAPTVGGSALLTQSAGDARYALAAALTALTDRVTALETAMAVVRTHTHLLGTIDAGTVGPTQVIP